MEWRINDGDIVSNGNETTQTESAFGKKVTSVLALPVNSVKSGSTISCRTYFAPQMNLESNIAINIPDYNHTWSSPNIKVVGEFKN